MSISSIGRRIKSSGASAKKFGEANPTSQTSAGDRNNAITQRLITSNVKMPRMSQGNIRMQPQFAPRMDIATSKDFQGLQGLNESFKNSLTNRITNQARGQVNDMSDAVQRRFASQGGLNSGAFLKHEALQRDQINQKAQDSINEQTQGLDSKLQEQLYQSGLQNTLQGQEADRQMEFQRAQGNADLAFKNRIAQFEAGSKLKEIDLAERSFESDVRTTDFNKRIAAAESKKGPGGILGGRVIPGIL